MWFATTTADCSADSRKRSQHDQEQTGISPNANTNKNFLLETLRGWHYPVAELIRATAEGDILREDAQAMTAGGLRLAAAAAAAWRRGGSGDKGGTQGFGGRVVLVGDAAHTVSRVVCVFGARVELEPG